MLKDLGRTDKLGGKLKNSGGSNEPMGSAVEDGKIEPDIKPLTKLKDNKLGGKLKNSGSAQEKFNGNGVAPMKGLGESLWNPSDISKLIGEGEIDLAETFKLYAENSDTLCLYDFNKLLESYDAGSRVDEDGFRMLMDDSQDYFFYEHAGPTGSFYLKESVDTGAIADAPNALGDEEEEELNEDISVGPMSANPMLNGPANAARRPALGPTHGPARSPMGGARPNPAETLGGVHGGIDGSMGGSLGDGIGDMGGDMGEVDPLAAAAMGDEGGLGSGDEVGPQFQDNAMGLTADNPETVAQGGAGAGVPGMQQPELDGGGEWFESVQNVIGRDMVAEDVLNRMAKVLVTHDPNKVSELCAKHRSNLGDASVAAIYMEDAPLKIALDGMNNVVAVAGTTIGIFDTKDNRITSKRLDETFNAVPDEDGEYVFAEEACGDCGKDECECEGEVVEEEAQNGGSDTTELRSGKLGGKLKNSGSAQEDAGESKHGEASDGITTELKPNKLGGKLKNTGSSMEKFEGGGNVAPMKGGASDMKENAQKLLKSFKPIVEGYQKKHPKARPFFAAHCEGVKVVVRNTLSESVLDLEELAQVFGEGNVSLVVKFAEGEKGVGTYKIPTARSVTPRGPVVSEGKAIFRNVGIAKKFAQVLYNEGKVVRVKPHNWGASVSAKVSYPDAEQIFTSLK